MSVPLTTLLRGGCLPDTYSENWRQRLRGTVIHSAVNFHLEEDVRKLNAQSTRVDKEALKRLPVFLVSMEYVEKNGFVRFQDVPEQYLKHISDVDSYFALSHRWINPGHPDPDGLKAKILIDRVGNDGWLFVDFSSLPQAPRSEKEYRVFEEGLHQMWRVYNSPRCHVIILADDSYPCQTYTEICREYERSQLTSMEKPFLFTYRRMTQSVCDTILLSPFLLILGIFYLLFLPIILIQRARKEKTSLISYVHEEPNLHLEYFRRSWCILESVMATLMLNTDVSSRTDLNDAFQRYFGKFSSTRADTLALGRIPRNFVVQDTPGYEDDVKTDGANVILATDKGKIVLPSTDFLDLTFVEHDLFLFVVNVFNALTLSHCTNGADKISIIGQFNDFLNALRISQGLQLSVNDFDDVDRLFNEALESSTYTDYFAECFRFFGRGLEDPVEKMMVDALSHIRIPSSVGTSLTGTRDVVDLVKAKESRPYLERYVSELSKAHVKDVQAVVLGTGQSGKSTLLKQLKALYVGPPTELERKTWVPAIHANVRSSIKVLGQHIPSAPDSWSSDVYAEQFVTPLEAKQITEWLSTDSHEEEAAALLPSTMMSFLKQAETLSQPDYVPTFNEYLSCRMRTTGIQCLKFTITGTAFQISDTGGQRNERRKWIHAFENASLVIYLLALDCYDQMLVEEPDVNRMLDASHDFWGIVSERMFRECAMVMYLNKVDIFKEKIKHVPLSVCPLFPDAPEPSDDSDIHLDLIRDHFADVHSNVRRDKQLYMHVSCCHDEVMVAKIFDATKNIVIRSALAQAGLI